MLEKKAAYEKWLDIGAEQPPSFYRLLGMDAFESDKEVISQHRHTGWLCSRSFGSARTRRSRPRFSTKCGVLD